VFTDFPGHFGMTSTNYLTQTFRSNQGITDVASRFVQKNPSQMKKYVSSRDKTTQAVVVIRRYDKFEDIDEECEKCLTEIGSKKATEDKRTTVFIRGAQVVLCGDDARSARGLPAGYQLQPFRLFH
jgi:DNA helicase-4